jgi:hypothetical protein
MACERARLDPGSMEFPAPLRPTSLVALIATGLLIAGCGGGSASSNPPEATPPPVAQPPQSPATGILTVTVRDLDGKSVSGANVIVFDRLPAIHSVGALTDSGGTAMIGSLPATVKVRVSHGAGYVSDETVGVSQQGGTSIAVTLLPHRPRPTVALLPVEILGGSVNAARNELTLRITVIASPSASFTPAGWGDFSPQSTPVFGLELGDNADGWAPQCYFWLDLRLRVPDCGPPWGTSVYTVSVDHFGHDAAGIAPVPPSSATRSTMLVMDQSRRVSALDPRALRSFSSRRFIERLARTGNSLSIAGFAGSGGDPATPLSLPAQPLWIPRGTGAALTTDEAVLKSDVGVLEDLVGGSAPVVDALQAAVEFSVASAPPGERFVVVMLGGGDDSAISATQREAALASLRQQRDQTGVRIILIDGSRAVSKTDHRNIADLATVTRATTISLGLTRDDRDFQTQTWASGAFAALDLAADLVVGARLPSLTADFRIRAVSPGAFPPGSILRGVVIVESEICPVHCWVLPLEFAAEIP